MSSTTDWVWSRVKLLFGHGGCSVSGCRYKAKPAAKIHYCSLNLSDALIRTHYTLPPALDVNYCPHHRVRNADGLARVCIAQNQGITDLRGWANRPSWNAIVFFEGGPRLSGATGHIDLYDGSTRNALHATYQDAAAVSFWKLG